MNKHQKKTFRRDRRKKRIRGIGKSGSGKVFGTAERPRLTVYRSVKHIYVQVIDDNTGRTLAAVSSQSADLRAQLKSAGKNHGGNKDAATLIGKAMAAKAIAAGIGKVCFDRNGYMYHGRVKALADGAREGGLKF
jgi:large subunit ribosomal protein L18